MMQQFTLSKQLDESPVTTMGASTLIPVIHDTISSAVPQEMGTRNVAVFRSLLSQAAGNPSGVINSLQSMQLTADNIGLSNITTTVVPDGQQLLCLLTQNGHSDEVLQLIKKITIDGALWKLIPLLETLIENDKAAEVWSMIDQVDFEKEKRGFFGDRYARLLTSLKAKISDPALESALAKLA